MFIHSTEAVRNLEMQVECTTYHRQSANLTVNAHKWWMLYYTYSANLQKRTNCTGFRVISANPMHVGNQINNIHTKAHFITRLAAQWNPAECVVYSENSQVTRKLKRTCQTQLLYPTQQVHHTNCYVGTSVPNV